MPLCSRCGHSLANDARFCPACGAEQSSISQMATALSPSTPRTSPPPTSGPLGRLEASSFSSSAAFAAGQVLAGRYRVIGLLGKGGMGEVYRADDVLLEQPVALKFLPRALTEQPALLERFRAEVRIARQVSHPNVCRVYDIGEIDGQAFLSMEFVDGEDLASLLRRIGRLPNTKADEVARQLCAGLAAAHDRGVVHRDLKPSNVMLDGQGRVRVTDFGLAVRTEDGSPGEVSGTPAYMAPEQFEAKPATPQTDLYALGLILYEIYTGKRAVEGARFDDYRSQHLQSTPSSPADVSRDVDETVSRVILRCLEKDPARRPASALQVAAALPGGDPLAAALAAGETPSPQMIAASGGEGALSPRAAWSFLLGTVGAIVAIVAMGPWSGDFGLAPLTRSRTALIERADELIERLGYSRTARDADAWFERDYAPLKWTADHARSTVWRNQPWPAGAPAILWLRTSPRWMTPAHDTWRLSLEDPAPLISGMLEMAIDANGRLRTFVVVPPQVDSSAAGAPGHWAALFAAADLDTAAFTRIAPTWNPGVPWDDRAEWAGRARWAGDVPLRVVAASWRGRPVWFELLGPWSKPARLTPTAVAMSVLISDWAGGIVRALLLLVALWLGFRHQRSGRADMRGAVRMGIVVCGSIFGLSAIAGHHVGDLGAELGTALNVLGSSIMTAVPLVFMYLAFEPFVRRRAPALLFGWARAVEGRWNDPRVGRDVLVGGLAGAILALLLHFTNALPAWVPLAHQTPVPAHPYFFSGGRFVLAYLVSAPAQAILPGLGISAFFFILWLVFRRPWVAAIATAVAVSLVGLGGENQVVELPTALVRGAVLGWLLWRHGMLAACAMWLFHNLLAAVPLPIAGSVTTGATVLVLLLLIGVLLAAFRISLGSRKVFELSLDG